MERSNKDRDAFGETYLLLCCIQVQTWAQSLVYTLEELECKICYNRYDTRSRKPKLLGCLHRVCAKCLKKMVDMGEFTWQVDTLTAQSAARSRRCQHDRYLVTSPVVSCDSRRVFAVHNQLPILPPRDIRPRRRGVASFPPLRRSESDNLNSHCLLPLFLRCG